MVHAQYDDNGPVFKINRKVANVNPRKVKLIKERVGKDVTPGNQRQPCHFGRMSSYSTILPPLHLYPEELKAFLYKDFIDHLMLTILFQANLLNWCSSAKQVLPIQTTADGNCLLHAIAMALWGIDDDDLTLRRLLQRSLSGSEELLASMKSRWENERRKQDNVVYQGTLEYLSRQWKEEWATMIHIAEARRRPEEEGGLPYECLDEFHIFVLANILRRPIIVVADKMWRSLDGMSMQPQNFGGIYLPLCWSPDQCTKTPVLLAYNAMHFTPLVYQESGTIGGIQSMTANADYAFPIVHKDLTPMTVHFLLNQEETQVMELLPKYLTIIELDYKSDTGQVKIQAAKAFQKAHPDETNLIPDFFMNIESQYHHYLDREFGEGPETGPQKCLMEACQNVGNWTPNNGICDECIYQMQEPSRQVSLHGNLISYATPAEQVPPDLHNPNVLPANVRPANVRLPSYDEATGGRPEPANPPQHYIPSLLPVKCGNKDCQYFCSITTGDYCHECSNKMKAGVEIPSAIKVDMPVICSAPLCMNPGNVLTNNLCKVCYDQERFNTQGSVRPLPASAPPPSITSLNQGSVIRSSSEPLKLPTIPAEGPREQKRSLSASSSPLHHVLNQTNVPYQSAVFDDDRKPNSLPSNLDGMQKCLEPDCKLTGYSKYQGLCYNCFEQQRTLLNQIQGQQQSPKVNPAGNRPKLGDRPKLAVSEPMPNAKTTPQPLPCKNEGCEMFGTVENEGYCSKCFLTVISQASKKQQQQASSGAVPKRESNLRHAQFYPKCKKEGCNSVGHKSNNGYCVVCAEAAGTGGVAGAVGGVIVGGAAGGVIAGGAAGGVIAGGAAGGVIAGGATGGTEGGKIQQTKFKVEKYLCVNPGCEGVRINNVAAGDMCYWCYNKAVKGIDREAAPLPAPVDRERRPAPVDRERRPAPVDRECRPAPVDRDRREEIPVAASPALQHHNVCSNPKCEHPAVSEDVALCQRCLNVLEAGTNKSEVKKTTKKPENKPGEYTLPCATHDCENYRKPGRQGFCNDCYFKYLDPQVEVKRPVNPKVGESQLLKEKSIKCQTPGCDMYGSADKNNLCSRCFRRQLTEQYGRNPGNEPRPVLYAQGPYNVLPAANPNQAPGYIYDEPWGGKDVYRPIACHTPDCHNVANPQILNGFCNECFHVFQDIQLVPRYNLERQHYQEPKATPPPPPKAEKPRCKYDACDHFGNPSCFGFCHECYQFLLANAPEKLQQLQLR